MNLTAALTLSSVKRLSRPTIAEKRLSLTANGNVRYRLKTPYRDGTTHVIFEPLELMAHILVRHLRGRPAVVQTGNPADLSSPGWRRWYQSRGSTSPVWMRAILGRAPFGRTACVQIHSR